MVWRAFLLVALASTVIALDAVVAENPHEKQPSTSCCPAQSLTDNILPEALALTRQQDTFLRAEQKTHLGAIVPILHFKQPGRLSSLELPFGLVLLEDINPSGIIEVPAPSEQAADSWFPDYSWNHFIVCAQQEGSYRHLGWRFTRKPSATGAGPSSFVAMIVRVRPPSQILIPYSLLRSPMSCFGGRQSTSHSRRPRRRNLPRLSWSACGWRRS